jgi:arylsulfatase A-like enzyme
VREPFIASWPGRIPAGTRCDVPIINVDLYPTFLAAAGVSAPEGKILDGENLLPLFTRRSATLGRDAIFWHFPGYLDNPVTRGRDPVFRTRPVTAMRAEAWKLFLYHEEWQLDGGPSQINSNRAVELYHLGDDPGEHRDLAATHAADRDRELARLLAWLKRTGAPLPSQRNPAYSPSTRQAPPPRSANRP